MPPYVNAGFLASAQRSPRRNKRGSRKESTQRCRRRWEPTRHGPHDACPKLSEKSMTEKPKKKRQGTDLPCQQTSEPKDRAASTLCVTPARRRGQARLSGRDFTTVLRHRTKNC